MDKIPTTVEDFNIPPSIIKSSRQYIGKDREELTSLMSKHD